MKLFKRIGLALGASAALFAASQVHAQQVTVIDVLYCYPSFARFHEPLAQEFMKLHPEIKLTSEHLRLVTTKAIKSCYEMR